MYLASLSGALRRTPADIQALAVRRIHGGAR
jgi:hypothetical protein